MKLDIQLFAETAGGMEVDRAALEEVRVSINNIYDTIGTSLDAIKAEIEKISDNFDESIQADVQEVLTEIENGKVAHLEAIISLSDFLSSFLSILTANESKIGGELKEWIETFKTTITGVKQAYTAEGASAGVETVKTSLQNMAESGVKISGYTRGIVTETVNIIKNTGSLIKGATGNSPQELVQKSVGTIKSLFTSASSNPGGTIVSQLFGKLGSAFSSWITGKTA